MFFLRDLEQTISLHPSFFGPRVRDYLTNKLFQDAEGTCNGQYYIICVVDPYDISEGRVLPGIAKAEYTIRYRAVVWKPFRGEILDATVTSLNRMGFFADVGPLSVFVSNAMIPADIRWDPSATPPQYTNNTDQVIEKGTQLRLKIMGVRSDVANMYAVGTIKEDYLGLSVFFEPRFYQDWTYAPLALVAAPSVAPPEEQIRFVGFVMRLLLNAVSHRRSRGETKISEARNLNKEVKANGSEAMKFRGGACDAVEQCC